MHATGIRVDEHALSDFAAASGDASCLFLKFRIADEKFVRVGRGSVPASNTQEECWKEISKSLTDDSSSPCFLAAKSVSRESGKWLLIFFMPEGCTVRDRMVYAASASALKEGLGEGNFEAATYSISHAREASLGEYESAMKNMSHEDLLTLDEKTKLEGETQSHLAMSSVKQRAIVGLPIQAAEGTIEAITNVQKGSPSTVILGLKTDNQELFVDSTGNFTFEVVQTKLPADEPRYVLQNFTHEHEGQQQNAFVFVYYCPEDSKAKHKMVYSTCKQVVVKICENLSISLSKSIELSEAKELSTANIMEELYPQQTVKKVFKKPGRPGRGNARLITSPTSSPSP